MNKGKPSGSQAEAKGRAGARSASRERWGQAGAGPEWRKSQENEDELVHAGGRGPSEQNAGGRDHHGAEADEDHNP